MVESENKDSWRYFFKNLVRAIPEIEEEATVFISDRDKGLLAADGEFGGEIIRAIYAYHLIDNFTTKYSRTLKPLFWSICYANSITRFDGLIKELRALNPEAATYQLSAELKL